MFSTLDNQYNSYSSPLSYPAYLPSQSLSHNSDPQTQATILNSIEFTDLTNLQHEDSHRRRRRSNTQQDKEAASNMRIRRRAQNRASQRAFRERKERHVQHLEHELEVLETKHHNLEKSYSEVEGAHAKLKREVEGLREELGRLKAVGSREGSVGVGVVEMKTEDTGEGDENTNVYFDPFTSDGGFFGGGVNSCSSGGEFGF
ncbi:MAG: hypothetical protein Q9217_002969 [Psora testacea]